MQQPRPPSSWHVVIQEETSGPYTGAQLKLLVRDGKLMPDHLVWRDGLKDWIPAKRVRGLFTPVIVKLRGATVRLGGRKMASCTKCGTNRPILKILHQTGGRSVPATS